LLRQVDLWSDYMGLVVLVTGAAGNVGQQVCQDLIDRGHFVRALDVPRADFGRLEHAQDIEVAKGDLRDITFVQQAVEGCEWVVHLAAILPPASEADRERTLSVNVGGTKNLIDALQAAGECAPLVFASSVATYGDTSNETHPVSVEHPLRPFDVYGQSKALGEDLLRNRGLPCTILRIGGVAVPALLEPPEPWPFTATQRLEFINRDDAVLALVQCVGNAAVLEHTYNVAGGVSWQVHGRDYARSYYKAFELPPEEVSFVDRPGPYDWYDTVDSQRLLDYQRTSYPQFFALLSDIVTSALGT
jgi:nucleoside-diphosphate-sugar epimerase